MPPLPSDRASPIFQNLQNSEHCRALCSADSFHVLDHALTTFQLKLKENFHRSERATPFESITPC